VYHEGVYVFLELVNVLINGFNQSSEGT
jgi:hypothetical protein